MKKILEVTAIALAILGLMAAASDGPYFPVPNIIGAIVLAAVAIGSGWARLKRPAALNLMKLKTGQGRLDPGKPLLDKISRENAVIVEFNNSSKNFDEEMLKIFMGLDDFPGSRRTP